MKASPFVRLIYFVNIYKAGLEPWRPWLPLVDVSRLGIEPKPALVVLDLLALCTQPDATCTCRMTAYLSCLKACSIEYLPHTGLYAC
jgi:hypothetical protein